MKTKKLSKFAKILGIPLLLLGSPINAISSVLTFSKNRTKKSFISSVFDRSPKQMDLVVVEEVSLDKSLNQIRSIPFAAFGNPAKVNKKEKGTLNKNQLLEFLDNNNLLSSNTGYKSVISGNKYRKQFADRCLVPNTHTTTTKTTTSSASGSTTKTYTTTTTSINTVMNSVSCGNNGGSWHPNEPTILDATADQAVLDNSTITPFSNVIFNDIDGDDIIVEVSLDIPVAGTFSNLSGFTDNTDDTYTLDLDSTTDATAAIQGMIFTPTPNRLSAGDSETVKFTIHLNSNYPNDDASDDTTTVVITGADTNSAPPPPTLVSPATGATIGSTVTLSWNEVVDPDGDTVEYWISVYDNISFDSTWKYEDSASRLIKAHLPWQQTAFALESGQFASQESDIENWLLLLLLLSGISFVSLSLNMRKKYLIILLLVVLGISTCASDDDTGSETGGDKSATTTDLPTATITNLSAGTYYWKVTAKDEHDASTDSEISNFIVE
ncbi:MAG: hypothetical protein HOD92_00675 [Deltaproteobacteria bacterium]|jgi:hypothetical protein|nr:hypothetical protein [Deltaproteobacteria bacterium]MBT4526245.1 hypothetical protein [Deltaproteobacteria bacterium]